MPTCPIDTRRRPVLDLLPYVYSFAMLAALSGHTAMSAKLMSDVKVLYRGI